MMRIVLTAVATLALLAAPTGAAAQYNPDDATPSPAAIPGDLMAVPTGGMELILNAGFEANGGVGSSTVTDWTIFDVPGSIGGTTSTFGTMVVYTGTAAPISAGVIDAPTEGSFAVVGDSTGPSSSLIYQDIVVPAGATGDIQCDVYINNQAADFVVGPDLDWEANPNQHARLDLLDPAAAPDDTGAGVLETIFITNPGDPLVQSYQTVITDLSPYAGQTVRLRWAKVDNQFFFQGAVDNCSAVVTVVNSALGIPALDGVGLVLLVALLSVAALFFLRRRTA